MGTLSHEAPDQAAPRRPLRTRLIVLIALLLAGIAVATWVIVEVDQSDGLAIVTDCADAADVAWVTGDGDASAAFYAEDGIWDCPVGRREGRDNIGPYIYTAGNFDEVRHGDITEVEDGVFMYPAEAVARGQTWAFEVWVTLEDDISHTELTERSPQASFRSRWWPSGDHRLGSVGRRTDGERSVFWTAADLGFILVAGVGRAWIATFAALALAARNSETR